MFKKILAVALAAAMIFGLASTAFASSFSDTTGVANEKAVVKLASLAMLNGYPDGTFKPLGNITRAEFAAVVVRALGYESSAKLLTTTPAFNDCADAEWAWGYINVATSQGIIKGYPDGTFAPNANVTVAEAVTMLVRALGYENMATGVWPSGHILMGSQLGMLPDNLPGVNVFATRGIVAQLVSNVLDEVIMKWDPEALDVVPLTGSPTFVTRNDATMYTGWTVKAVDTDDNTVTVSKTDEDDTEWDVADEVEFAGAATLTAFKGQKVDFFVNDDDEVSYLGTVDTSGINGTVTAIDKVNKTITVGGTVYTVRDSATTWYNGTEIVGDAVAKIKSLVDAEVTLVLDSAGKVVYIEAIELNNDGVISSKQTTYGASGTVNQVAFGGAAISVDEDATFVRNGTSAAWADLKIGDSVKYATNATGEITYIDAFAATINGTLQEKVVTNDRTTFKLNDVVYSAYYNEDDEEEQCTDTDAVVPGQAVTLTLDRDGYVTAIELQQSTSTAAVTLQSKSTKVETDGDLVRTITLSDGTVATLAVDGVGGLSLSITRNDMVYAIDATGFTALQSGDSLLITYTSGKATAIKAFASVSGYVYNDGTDVWVTENSDGSGDKYAIVDPLANYSTLLVNGVQTVVTGATTYTTGDEIKISSWKVTSTEQYPNLVMRHYDNTGFSVKGILSDGNDTVLIAHKGTLGTPDVYVKLTDTAVLNRSDAAIEDSAIAIGDKVKFHTTVAVHAGTLADPYQVVYLNDSVDTTKPGFSDPQPAAAWVVGTGAVVTFDAKEDVLVSFKVYNSVGTEVDSATAVEKSSAAGQTVTWDGLKSDGTAAPAGSYTIVLTFKDYASNAADPISVLVTKP
ncbi:MAG: S-layer homology domain-containing protein [Bacillota bacterium]